MEDWGTLETIRGITAPLENPIILGISVRFSMVKYWQRMVMICIQFGNDIDIGV